MKRSLTVVLLSLALVVGIVCMVSAAETVIPLDPYKATTRGSGQWKVQEGASGFEVVQEALSGDVRFYFDGITLPDNFYFEAELGCITGNNPTQRPYFGLYVNVVGDDFLVFRFRPSSKHWEIAKASSASASEVLMTFDDPNPWAWDLQEWRTLRIERVGNKVNTYVNGELTMSMDYEGAPTGGSVGFFAYSTAAVFRKAKLVAY